MPPTDPPWPDCRPPGEGVVPGHGPLDDAPASRRAFLLAALASGVGLAVSGCAHPGRTATLPGPSWPEAAPRPHAVDRRAVMLPESSSPVTGGGVIPRRSWAAGAAVPTRMRRMLPVRYITVHHSAGPAFEASDHRRTAERLESIRRYHRDDLEWGDIGYHFAVDRAGRVWECRSLHWQGAHVKDCNESNLGVVALGNFDHQAPSPAQLDALLRHVSRLMRNYQVPVARLRTHQEWAPTACPGRSLQRQMVAARADGRFA